MATHDKFSRKRERYFINFCLRESILVTQNYFFILDDHTVMHMQLQITVYLYLFEAIHSNRRKCNYLQIIRPLHRSCRARKS